jgi:hypothetical protein
MSRLLKLSRIVCGGGLTFWVVSACGGRSFTRDDGYEPVSGQGGSVSVAGTSSAGSFGAGGKVGFAGAGGSGSLGGTGTGSAGVGLGGTGTGAAGASAGGYAGEGCTAPPVDFQCDAYIPAWYHDPDTGICRPFVYGGCNGNENRYASLAECQKACHGGDPDYDACAVASDCVIASNGCCGVCDVPDLSAHDVIAYNPKFQRQLLCNFVRGASAPDSDVPACEPCPPTGAGVINYLVAQCVQHQCSVLDLRDPSFSACESDADCVLRHGTGCCQSCSNAELVALRKDVAIEKLVCDGAVPPVCAACTPSGSFARAVCSAGRCTVVDR